MLRIGLADCPCVEPSEPGGVPDWTQGLSPLGALKNKEVFRIRLVDRPRVKPYKQGGVPDWTCRSSPRGAIKTRKCSGLDSWIIPAFCSGSAPHRALKTGRCSKLDPNVLFSFLTQFYYPHASRASVSPVCRIVYYNMNTRTSFTNSIQLKITM